MTAKDSNTAKTGNATAQSAVTADGLPKRIDKHIWGIYIALCVVSVVELYSASSHEVSSANVFAPVIRHVVFLVAGLVLMLMLQRTHYKKFYNWIWLFAIFSACAMVYTMFFGDYINGARRSFSIAFMTLQPAEMVKISAALIIAAILCREQNPDGPGVTNRGMWQVSVAVFIGGVLLFSDGLTNTLLLMCISISMMLIGGVSWSRLLLLCAIFVVFGLIGVGAKLLIGASHSDDSMNAGTLIPGTEIVVGGSSAADETGRVSTWKNRMTRHLGGTDKVKEPITNENQQEQYSYIAQAHGGVLGVMPGNSRETARLPLAFSDYIFAIIIEELGLVGGCLVLILYLWLLARAGRIASRCQTAFPALLVIGMAVFITFQALFHMAIVTGVLPVSGQPLPLISKGGTSIIITSCALGIMLSVSRFAARKGKSTEIKEELKELSELPAEVKARNLT